jgi:hypothetical protein
LGPKPEEVVNFGDALWGFEFGAMVGVVALWLVAAAAASADGRRPSLSADNLVYADNGVIKVGMSLDRGGSIAFLVRAFVVSLSCLELFVAGCLSLWL